MRKRQCPRSPLLSGNLYRRHDRKPCLLSHRGPQVNLNSRRIDAYNQRVTDAAVALVVGASLPPAADWTNRYDTFGSKFRSCASPNICVKGARPLLLVQPEKPAQLGTKLDWPRAIYPRGLIDSLPERVYAIFRAFNREPQAERRVLVPPDPASRGGIGLDEILQSHSESDVCCA